MRCVSAMARRSPAGEQLRWLKGPDVSIRRLSINRWRGSARDVACCLARCRYRVARRAGHQATVVRDGNEAESHADHARGVGSGAVMQAGELAVLLAACQQLLVDAEDQRLLAIEHRDEAERKAQVRGSDIDSADAGY